MPLLRAKPFKNLTVGAILAGLGILLILTLAVLYCLTIPHRRLAGALLHDISELTPGTSTFTDAELLAHQYGGIPWYVSPTDMTCTFQRCTFAFQLDNMPLSYVPGVGYTRFFALVDIKNGIVVGREIEYESSRGTSRHFRYVILDFQGPPPIGWAYGVWRLQVDPHGVPHVLEVKMGPSSSKGLRDRAYALRLSCLARFYGCGGPKDIYPTSLDYMGPPSQGLVPNEQ